ncbi:hypothetical protein S40293_05449 [Stachybotrys chartarum IBT 40293]|nr:hypothetical protein S40293_05449 [Stachybotrys chartarum IBT 40293]
MEAGEYETNTLLINDIASIHFHVYEPSPEQSQAFPSAAIELESALRDRGYIVIYDPNRRALWRYSITTKHDKIGPHEATPDATINVAGWTLTLTEDGSLEPSSLHKGRTFVGTSAYTPTSSSSSGSALEPHQRAAFLSPSQPSGIGQLELEPKVTGLNGNDSKAVQGMQKAIYENFIAAVLLTVSTSFCRRVGALPLNYRTVLLPQDEISNWSSDGQSPELDPVLGAFRLYLTTTGALVFSLSFHQCSGLLNLGSVVAASLTSTSQPIIAAPFGVLAHRQRSNAGEIGLASLAQTPNTQTLSLRAGRDTADSFWKQACLKFLRCRGVEPSPLSDCPWVSLLVSKKRFQDNKGDTKRSQHSSPSASIPWPGPLCFRKRTIDVSTTSLVGDTMLSSHEESHDPLGYASAWLASAADRDEKLQKRKSHRASTARKELSDRPPEAPKTAALSPLDVRRPNTNVAMGAMYPTPPDGIQQLNGITPSLDGTISSPGNMVPTATVVDVDTTAQPSGIEETFNHATEFSEPKRERSDSNLLGDGENVFTDMDGDMFGENDITEADFNFFDEQPGDEDLDISLGDLEAMVDAQQPTTSMKSEQEPQPAMDETIIPLPPIQNDAVFTKPELRHARSSLIDEGKRSNRAERSGPLKRDPSPFDTHTVLKRVRASLQLPNPDSENKNSVFAKVDFGSALPVINRKYERGGFFDYNRSPRIDKPKIEPGALPQTDYLKRHAKHSRKMRDHQLPVETLVKGGGLATGTPMQLSPIGADAPLSDVEDSSEASDQDDSSYTTDEPGSPLKSSIKPTSIEDDVLSQGTSFRDMEPVEEIDHHLAVELPRLVKPEAPEIPLAKLFADAEPLPVDLSLSDEDLVQIGQLLADQAATGYLQIRKVQKTVATGSMPTQKGRSLAIGTRGLMHVLEDIMLDLLGPTHACRLKGLLDVQDVPLLGQPSRLQPRPIPGRDPNAEQLRLNNLYQIWAPQLEVRRAETRMTVLPSAINFWESLGLAPSSGNKNVLAIGIFPGWRGVAENVGVFLERMKNVYELLKMGSFENAPLPAEFCDGLMPYELEKISTSPDATLTSHGSALVEIIDTLKATLMNLDASEKNVVVYFVYSPTHPATIVESCVAFQRLFESYQKTLAGRREAPVNELVLQLIPVDILSSSNGVVVTTPPELAKLCVETYDRCTLFNGPMPAPAVKLAQALPRHIDFKLVHQPSASLLHENSCIHIAYTQSVDDRWVSAAWTDDRGNQQATAAYCLARRGKPLSLSMHDIAHEIWKTTLDLISVWKVHWRVVITKCSPMDSQEIDFWLDLARTEIKANVTMTLMTVDTAPSLQLIPPLIRTPATNVSFYSTPVSTPQANIVSPEQSGTPMTPARDSAAASAATPGADGTPDAEADAVLVDVTEQTWGAVVGHRLSNSTTILDLQPALASGYLIKRASNRVEDAPVVMEVNLIHAAASNRPYEWVLREMLSNFRGLGTLARARGMVDRETDVRPWHVAAAEKALRALYLLL